MKKRERVLNKGSFFLIIESLYSIAILSSPIMKGVNYTTILLIILTLALIVLALNLIGAIFTGAAYIIDYIEVIALIVGIVFIVRHFINKKKNQ